MPTLPPEGEDPSFAAHDGRKVDLDEDVVEGKSSKDAAQSANGTRDQDPGEGNTSNASVQQANGSTGAITAMNAKRFSALKGEGAECSICFSPLPDEQCCVLIRQVYGKKRSCRHYFHMGCVQLLMRQTPAPHLCPLCRGPFERLEALPDVRLNSRAWFETVECDERTGLDKSEVVDALSATLPVDPELLWQSLDGELWDQWDTDNTGRISLANFEQPGKGLLHFVLYSLPSLRREAGSTNISAPVPDLVESREGWFRYWDENSKHMLEFIQFLRALARTLRLDGAKEDAGVLRSVLSTVWQEFGLLEQDQEIHKPVTLALFCEKPDGFCDVLVDALKKEFGPAKFRRIRQRAHLLQQPASVLKKELRKLNSNRPDLLEKHELVSAILDLQEGEPQAPEAASPTTPASPSSPSAVPKWAARSQARTVPAGLQALALKELQLRLRAYGVAYGHCLERGELEDLLIAQGDTGVEPLPESSPSPNIGRPHSAPVPSSQTSAQSTAQRSSTQQANASPTPPFVQTRPQPQVMGAASASGNIRIPANQPIPTVTEPPDKDDLGLRRCMNACVLQ